MRQLFRVVLLAAALVTSTSRADVQRDIEYANIEGESQKLDASVPDGDGPFPIAIIIHGGGWSKGDKTKDIDVLFQPLSDAKFTWFSINYRLAPDHRWPDCLDDVRTAIRWVKAHAEEFKGDPQRVVLFGHSAGGHLAAFAGTTGSDDTRVQGTVLLAAVTDLEADSERRGGLSTSLQGLFGSEQTIDDDARAILRDASPINHLSAETPPCLLINGSEDKTAPCSLSESYKAKLDELGVPCELITISGGGHGLEPWKALEPGYQPKMIDWLHDTLKTER